MSQSFKELTPAKAKTFLKILNQSGIEHGFQENSKFLAQDLNFTKGWARIDAEDYSESPFIQKSYLVNDNQVKPFLFTDRPLNDNFSDVELNIDEKTVVPYLLLYCHLWVQNGEQIKPILNFDDVSWQGEISPTMRKSLDQDFREYPKISTISESWMVTLICLFQHSLMTITFDVTNDGIVTIKDRVVLVDDLPVKNLP